MALIHSITNYATKGNCNQYQRVIALAIVKKVFNNHDNNLTTDLSNYTPTLDKFILKAFNQLFYNRKISGSLIASYLLNSSDYYSPKAIVKTINIVLLQAKFLLILDNKSFN